MQLNPEQVAARFGCSIEQARAQYAKNAAQMRDCAAKAGAGKYRGYTAAQWAERARHFEEQEQCLIRPQ